MPRSDNEAIIVCVGSRLDWQCADVIDRITRAGSHPNWRFVLHGWLDGHYADAAVAWVTDCNVGPDALHPLLAARLPILVPESNPALLQLCKSAGCGLFYRAPEDITACLELLISDAALRTVLGENGFQYALR